ncbi:hypothetical protein AX16_006449, partial [Volvariella volvacea WC 439]
IRSSAPVSFPVHTLLMFLSLRLLWFLVASHVLSPVLAFSFSHSEPTECDDITVSWSGGTGPFELLLIPVWGTPRNLSIPPSAFSNGQGSFSTQLQFPRDHKFLLSMSDATGFGAGGSTNVLTVGTSRGGSCNATDPGVDFSFELNMALQQCRPFVFSGYTRAILPVTIFGIVPGGTSFILNPPEDATEFSWIANAAQETSLVFFMTDSEGRQGGSSDVRIVAFTDDRWCLDANSPSSTPSVPTLTSETSTPSSTPSTSTSAPSTPDSSSEGVSIGAIAASVIGSLLFLAVVITLGLFFLKRRQDRHTSSGFGRRPRSQSEVDLAGDDSSRMYPYQASSTTLASNIAPSPFPSTSQLDQNPFGDLQSRTVHHEITPYPPPSQYPPSPPLPYTSGARSDLASPPYPSTTAPSESAGPSDRTSTIDSMSTSQRKAALAGVSTYRPTRFIVHTDADDILPPPNEDGVVELPPQYSESRAPVPGFSPYSGSSLSQPPHTRPEASSNTR